MLSHSLKHSEISELLVLDIQGFFGYFFRKQCFLRFGVLLLWLHGGLLRHDINISMHENKNRLELGTWGAL